MPIFKIFIFLFLSVFIYANDLEKIVYVENLDKENKVSLKNEFFNKNTEYFTISVGRLISNRHSAINYFKTYKLQNALAYKYGKDLEYTRVVSGIYKTYKEAKEAINSLDERLLRNRPYAIRLKRHQNMFVKYNSLSSLSSKMPSVNSNSNSKNKVLKEAKNSIFISGSRNSEELKTELLKNGSKLYALSLATLGTSEKSIKNYFKQNGISDKALAHVYGKRKDKTRVIYGLYSSYKDAQEAINTLNKSLRANKPYAMRMKSFQSFYKKYNKTEENNIVQLKINDKKTKMEKVDKPKLNADIKVVKLEKKYDKEIILPKRTKVLRKEIKTKPPRKKVVKKEVKKKPVKTKKKKIIKPIKKEDLNKNRYLKHSVVEDIYYIESDGSFNILNEVFLNDSSSFYTLDLGEIKLKEVSIEEFFLNQGIHDNALSYKYGDKKEYARAIYGAYETKETAKNAAKKLKLDVKDIKVSNIKNHQKLFKMYHEDILKKGPVKKIVKKKKKEYKKVQKVRQVQKPDLNSDIVYLSSKTNEVSLKDEFFKSSSPFYTITLITFHKNDLSPEEFISDNQDVLDSNLLAFSLGSQNNYYRVIYGVFKSSKDALAVIASLNDKLLSNKPYVSKVRTSKRRFESYNDRKVSAYRNFAKKLN